MCVALGFALIFGMALRYPDTAFASELTNDSIKQKEAEISKAKEEKKASEYIPDSDDDSDEKSKKKK